MFCNRTRVYSYGFNGKENDNEIVGTGEGTQDYGLRIYNPALGRFLSVDPLTKSYPWYTPYQFAGNKPINSIDLDGAEEFEKISPADVDAGLKERTAKGGANKIDQGMTPTCGIAAVCNVVAENDPKGYGKTVIDLYTNY